MKQSSPEKGDADEISEVNIVPLADISLVLLIVLMIITPMVMQSMIKVHASRAAVAQARGGPSEKALFLEIKPEGFFLNTRSMRSEQDLFLHLRGELSRKSDKTVIVTAGPGVLHGTVVTALDLAKQAGAAKLSLVKRAGAPS